MEEGDPPPPDSAEVPDRLLDDNPDPDDVWGVSQSYAGQVSLLDTCLGALEDFLQGSPLASDTLFALTSARGFPLGEHGRIGPCDDALYGELVHVPLALRFPDNIGRRHAESGPGGAGRPLGDPAGLLAARRAAAQPIGRQLDARGTR